MKAFNDIEEHFILSGVKCSISDYEDKVVVATEKEETHFDQSGYGVSYHVETGETTSFMWRIDKLNITDEDGEFIDTIVFLETTELY